MKKPAFSFSNRIRNVRVGEVQETFLNAIFLTIEYLFYLSSGTQENNHHVVMQLDRVLRDSYPVCG